MRQALALEQWNLSAADLVITPGGAGPGAPSGYSAQAPDAAVAAAAGLSWSAVNQFNGAGGWGPTYGGFPENAQTDGPWPGSPWPTADGYPVATGTYTTTGNWGGQQMVFVDQTGSGAQMFITSGLVSFPGPFGSSGASYPMPSGAPGGPGNGSGVIGPLTALLMSNFVFAPLYLAAVPYGAPGYLWANGQFASRVRYRVNHPYAGLPGLRLNCELWVRNLGATGWPEAGWGASAADWSQYPATTGLVITARNFSFHSFLAAQISTATGATATAGGWVEVPLPAVPAGWDAAANAANGLLGLAVMDFPGFRTRAQWEAAAGVGVVG